jgi:hypothetical protein
MEPETLPRSSTPIVGKRTSRSNRLFIAIQRSAYFTGDLSSSSPRTVSERRRTPGEGHAKSGVLSGRPFSTASRRRQERSPASSSVRDLLGVGWELHHDESRSPPRIHDSRMRVRHRPLSRGRNEPRNYLRRREGHELPAPGPSSQSHADDDRIRLERSNCKSVISVPHGDTWAPEGDACRLSADGSVPDAGRSGPADRCR